MRTLQISQFAFLSFCKLFLFAGFAAGLAFGVLAFVLSLLGVPVTATLWVTRFEGFEAVVIILFLGPILFAAAGGLCAMLTYLPFRLLLRLVGGMTIRAVMDGEHEWTGAFRSERGPRPRRQAPRSSRHP